MWSFRIFQKNQICNEICMQNFKMSLLADRKSAWNTHIKSIFKTTQIMNKLTLKCCHSPRIHLHSPKWTKWKILAEFRCRSSLTKRKWSQKIGKLSRSANLRDESICRMNSISFVNIFDSADGRAAQRDHGWPSSGRHNLSKFNIYFSANIIWRFNFLRQIRRQEESHIDTIKVRLSA